MTGAGATAAPVLKANGGSQFQADTLAGADTPAVVTGGESGASNASVKVGGNIDFEIDSNGTTFMKPNNGYGMAISTGTVQSLSR